jgi:hypothetical protein
MPQPTAAAAVVVVVVVVVVVNLSSCLGINTPFSIRLSLGTDKWETQWFQYPTGTKNLSIYCVQNETGAHPVFKGICTEGLFSREQIGVA